MPEKYFTVPKFLTRHLQILRMGGGGAVAPLVSYSYGDDNRLLMKLDVSTALMVCRFIAMLVENNQFSIVAVFVVHLGKNSGLSTTQYFSLLFLVVCKLNAIDRNETI